MSDLSAAAEAMGIPEPLVERSAQARADATGQSLEQVLAAWAGGEAVAAAPETAAPEPATEEPATEPVAAEEAAAPAAAPAAPAQPAEPVEPAAAAAITPPPAPERVSPEEALEHPVVVTVPTAGITERTGFSIPAWLATLLLVVPVFGLIYLAVGATATCGVGTELRVDRVTGLVENCDGTPFEGRGAGGGGADFIATAGTQIWPTCAGCHGQQGEGGVGPALGGVMTTFGSCADHIEWIALGSAGFQDEGTYGDTNKPVGGGMPPFAGSLSEEQIASIAAYERVRIAGANQQEVLADCGLAAGGGGEGGGGAAGGGGTEALAAAEADTWPTCAGCHGQQGEGGVGPALSGVTTTFGSCADHIEWITLGSAGFQEEGTYGDTDKPVAGGMPAFGDSLTGEQIAAIAAYERVRIAGADPQQALADCGVVGGDGGGEGGAGEGSESTDTTGAPEVHASN